MYARVILGRVKHDRQNEAIQIYREIVEPTAKAQKGFKRMHLLTDPDSNKFISITIWESKKDMIASEASGYLQEQLDKLAALFVAPPIIQYYIVSD